MRLWLEYYLDQMYGSYGRTMRRWKWRGQYYVLPAYRHLLAPDTPWERLRSAWHGLQDHLDGRLSRYALVAAAVAVAFLAATMIPAETRSPAASTTPPASSSAASAVQPPNRTVPAPAAAPSPVPPTQPVEPPFLFGLGAQADGAMRQKLYREAPVGMLTSWFNGPDDLNFMRGWQRTTVPQAYASGKAMHLIVWTGDDETPLKTKYGPACGRSYPFSDSFASDMRELATIYNGNGSSGTLLVSMFTEFQTYPCQDNQWKGNENYFRALQDQYSLARSIFKQHAPNSQVSLTWGGWQASWDDPAVGAGRSLMPHFAGAMRASDFQSFQAMDSTSNIRHIADMTRLLHSYGGGNASPAGRVMVAHFKPDNGNQVTWRQDLELIFSPTYFQALRSQGLFAFSFMDEKNMLANDKDYALARQTVESYTR